MKTYKLLFILLIHVICINHIYAQGIYEKVTSADQIESSIKSGKVFIIARKNTVNGAMGLITNTNHNFYYGNKISASFFGEDNICCIKSINSPTNPYEITITKYDDKTYLLKTLQGYLGTNKTDLKSSNSDEKPTNSAGNINKDYIWNIEFTANQFLNAYSENYKEYYIGWYDGFFRAYKSGTRVCLYTKCTSVPITISSVKYATLYYSNKNLVVPEGVEAYTFKYADDKLQISNIYKYMDIIPKRTAVVLHGNAGTYDFAEVSSEGTVDENNILKGTDEDIQIDNDDNYYFYMLSLDNSGDPASVGFYWGEDYGKAFRNGANKAYLSIPKTNVTNAKTSFCFSDITEETTHITSPNTKISDNNNYYTVQGVMVNNPVEKGIYIFNGRKIVIK